MPLVLKLGFVVLVLAVIPLQVVKGKGGRLQPEDGRTTDESTTGSHSTTESLSTTKSSSYSSITPTMTAKSTASQPTSTSVSTFQAPIEPTQSTLQVSIQPTSSVTNFDAKRRSGTKDSTETDSEAHSETEEMTTKTSDSTNPSQSSTTETSTTEKLKISRSRSASRTPSRTKSSSLSSATREKTDSAKRTVDKEGISATPSSVTLTTSSGTPSKQGKTKEDFEITLKRPFTPDLKDKNSTTYQELEKEVLLILTNLLKNLDGFWKVVVNGFAPGSIVVSSSAYFTAGSSTSSSAVQSTLTQAQQRGDLSSLGVTEITYGKRTNRDNEDRGGMSTFTYVLIAVGVIVGIVVCIYIVSKVRNKKEMRSKMAKKEQELDSIKSKERRQTAKQAEIKNT